MARGTGQGYAQSSRHLGRHLLATSQQSRPHRRAPSAHSPSHVVFQDNIFKNVPRISGERFPPLGSPLNFSFLNSGCRSLICRFSCCTSCVSSAIGAACHRAYGSILIVICAFYLHFPSVNYSPLRLNVQQKCKPTYKQINKLKILQ